MILSPELDYWNDVYKNLNEGLSYPFESVYLGHHIDYFYLVIKGKVKDVEFTIRKNFGGWVLGNNFSTPTLFVQGSKFEFNHVNDCIEFVRAAYELGSFDKPDIKNRNAIFKDEFENIEVMDCYFSRELHNGFVILTDRESNEYFVFEMNKHTLEYEKIIHE